MKLGDTVRTRIGIGEIVNIKDSTYTVDYGASTMWHSLKDMKFIKHGGKSYIAYKRVENLYSGVSPRYRF